jgi:uncharacterized membrane protein YkoI
MGLAALAALGLGGGALAQAGSSGQGAEKQAEHGEHDKSATGSGADKAKAAALRITRGGHANAVELDGENGATWEVEVTKPNGTTVDVRLDQDYKLVVVERDGEG